MSSPAEVADQHASVRSAEARSALDARLRAIAPYILESVPEPLDDPTADAAAVLDRIIDQLRGRQLLDKVWLLLVALTGTMPTADRVREIARGLELALTDADAAIWVLAECRPEARVDPMAKLEIVTDRPIVDVTFSAQHDLMTGIQRVVRRLLPRWARDHDIIMAAWTALSTAYRGLADSEIARVLHWDTPTSQAMPRARGESRVLVPWQTTVVLPEVPALAACERLAAIAELSGSKVVVIGYDAIPSVSAETVPPAESDKFARYLQVIKHCDRVAGISRAAATEFQGFADALPAQGLTGPTVAEVALPVDVPLEIPEVDRPALPLVVCVGSEEPRKNHLAVLFAAEVLWREGLRFELEFIGRMTWDFHEFAAEARRLRRAGRPLRCYTNAGDDLLWNKYREATFTVFPSTHEGFGLPVAESLAIGTPAITSNFGSMAEIAADGGALTVDPRDDDDITAAMRRMLTEPELVAKLSAEALARPQRTWDDYADELWEFLLRDEAESR